VILKLYPLREANRRRHKECHANPIGWSVMEWACAMAGEAGEACNVAKKIRRVEQEIAKSKVEIATPMEEWDRRLAEECADVLIYLDLLCASRGIDLEAAVVAKFNKVSEAYGFEVRL